MIRLSRNCLKARAGDQRGLRNAFGVFVKKTATHRMRPDPPIQMSSKNRSIAPPTRYPLVNKGTIHKLRAMPINKERVAVEKAVRELGYVRPRASYTFQMIDQPLKHKMHLASGHLDHQTKHKLIPPGPSEDLWPDWTGREDFKMEIPAWKPGQDNNWYPTGMRNAFKKIRKTFHKYDMVIELHDARIPFTGRNPKFYDYLRGKPYVLLLTHYDKAPYKTSKYGIAQITSDKAKFQEYIKRRIQLKQPGITAVEFANLNQQVYVDFLRWGNEFSRKIKHEWVTNTIMKLHREEAGEINVLLVGLPNVGKSKLINILRQACHFDAQGRHLRGPDALRRQEGPKREPGTTRKVQERVRVSSSPLIYMTDTPGIFHHKLPSLEVAMKLSTTNKMKQATVGKIGICDYILFELNRQRLFHYVTVLNFEEPCDDIQTVLQRICSENNLMKETEVLTGTGSKRIKVPDYTVGAQWFLTCYERGMFGSLFLDQDQLDRELLATQGTLLRYSIENSTAAEVRREELNSTTANDAEASISPPSGLTLELPKEDFKLELQIESPKRA